MNNLKDMNELEQYRFEIDKVDRVIAEAYALRLHLVNKIGEYKKNNNVDILNSDREKLVYDNVSSVAGDYVEEVKDLYSYIMDYSKKKQAEK